MDKLRQGHTYKLFFKDGSIHTMKLLFDGAYHSKWFGDNSYFTFGVHEFPLIVDKVEEIKHVIKQFDKMTLSAGSGERYDVEVLEVSESKITLKFSDEYTQTNTIAEFNKKYIQVLTTHPQRS